MTADALLELRDVHACYGAIEVLRGVDLAVRAGEITAVLGPNGAGKSTLLRVAAAVHPIERGDLVVAGRRVNGVAPDRLARRGLCLVPETRGVFPRLTVRENLWMNTYRGVSRVDVEEAAFASFPRLAERRDALAGTLSGGEQQQLALARAISTEPAVLLLDELSMGLAPLLVQSLYETVREIANGGCAVLVVEQFANAVLGIADRAAIMVGGRIVRAGAPDEIEAQLASAYLGS